jgi:aminoglycoside phosphotransferase (APT) family kinase protein
MHAFDLEVGATTQRLVLRRYPSAAFWPSVLSTMLRFLALLENAGIRAPRAVWSDVDGRLAGQPVVVLTRLRGRSLGAPADPISWSTQLGAELANIHAVGLGREDLAHLPPALEVAPSLMERVRDPAERLLQHPLATSVLPRLEALYEDSIGASRPTFTHGDYWPGQAIWWRGQLQGIVDWDFPRFDDPGIDLGYCRMDIALLAGVTAPATFLQSYEEHGGMSPDNLEFWDLLAVLQAMEHPDDWHRAGFIGLKRDDLQGSMLRRRLIQFTDTCRR